MYTVTKSYRDLPAAHRQPNHDGHCRLIHGHNWGFDITFKCLERDKNGFVIDVGRLADVKRFLKRKFDHTLLLNESDPILDTLNQVDASTDIELFQVVTVPNCGMEGLAEFVFGWVTDWLIVGDAFNRGVEVVRVTCWEDSKNSATYEP